MIVTRGCYRWYGTRRNDSDCDHSDEEHRDNLLNEELEEELKYGPEFLQSDRPHMAEQLQRKYSRGGYRHYEVQRNAYDIMPEEMAEAETDPEWRRKHHSNGYRYMNLGMCDDEEGSCYSGKGKPFKRTILNKVYELKKQDDSPDRRSRYGTRVSLVPGEGSRTLYEGKPDRYPYGKKAASIVDVFKKKSERSRIQKGSDYEEYEREDVEKRHEELRPEHADRMRQMAAETRRPKKSQSSESKLTGESVAQYAYGTRPVAHKRSDKENKRRDKEDKNYDKEEKRYDLREEQYSYSHIERPSQGSQGSRSTRFTDDRFSEMAPKDHVAAKYTKVAKKKSSSQDDDDDVRETFETWKENVDQRREESREEKRSREKTSRNEREEPREEKRSREKTSRNEREDREYSSHKVDKQRNGAKTYGHSEQESQGSKGSARRIKNESTQYEPRAPVDKRKNGAKTYGYSEQESQGNKGSSRRLNDEITHYEKRTPAVKRFDKEEKRFDHRKESYIESYTESPTQGSKDSRSTRDNTQRRFTEMPAVKRSDKEEKRYDSRKGRFSNGQIEQRPSEKSKVYTRDTGGRFAEMGPASKLSDRRQDTKFESRDKPYSRTEPKLPRSKNSGRSIRNIEDESEETHSSKDEILKKVPPHIEKRMREIQEKLERNLGPMDDCKNTKRDERPRNSSHSFDIDLMKHKSHPMDRGHTDDDQYEKYTTKNGSQLWMKKEEKYSELHHRDR